MTIPGSLSISQYGNTYQSYNVQGTGSTGQPTNVSVDGVSVYDNANNDVTDFSSRGQLRARMRALSASSNAAQEGVSTMQTADSALEEVQRMIERMKELSSYASGTDLTEDDRYILQEEIDLLNSEIDRVSEGTSFGGRTLLKGDVSAAPRPSFHYSGVTQTAAAATIPTHTATGMSLSVSFVTAGAGVSQNALANSLKNDGINVKKSIKTDALTGRSVSAYEVSFSSAVSSNYNISAVEGKKGAYTISDLSGNVLARMTVSGGSESVEVVSASRPTEARRIDMVAQDVQLAVVDDQRSARAATATFATSASGGFSVAMSFVTATAGAVQNTLASSLMADGISVTKELRSAAGTSAVSVSYGLNLNGSRASDYRVVELDSSRGSFAIDSADGSRLALVTVSGGRGVIGSDLVVPENVSQSARLVATSVTGGRVATDGIIRAAEATFSGGTGVSGLSGIRISFTTSAAGAAQNSLARSLMTDGININRTTSYDATTTVSQVNYGIGLNFSGYDVSASSSAAGSFVIKDKSGNVLANLELQKGSGVSNSRSFVTIAGGSRQVTTGEGIKLSYSMFTTSAAQQSALQTAMSNYAFTIGRTTNYDASGNGADTSVSLSWSDSNYRLRALTSAAGGYRIEDLSGNTLAFMSVSGGGIKTDASSVRATGVSMGENTPAGEARAARISIATSAGTGLAAKISFTTATAGSDQNAIADAIMSGGVSVSKSIVYNSETGQSGTAYAMSINMPSSLSGRYAVETVSSAAGSFAIRETTGERRLVASIDVSGGADPEDAYWSTHGVERESANMYATAVTAGNQDIDRAIDPARVEIKVDAASGMKATMSFVTTAGSREQNALAEAIGSKGLEVSRNASFNAATSTVSVSYSVSIPTSVGAGYSVRSRNAAAGSFEILSSSGQSVAFLTVSGGSDRVSQATMRASSVKESVEVVGETKLYDKNGNAIPENALENYLGAYTTPGNGTAIYIKDGAALYDSTGAVATTVPQGMTARMDIPGDLTYSYYMEDNGLEVGLSVNLRSMSSSSLGLDSVRVDGKDGSNAKNATAVIDEALNKVKEQRNSVNMMEGFLGGVVEREQQKNAITSSGGSISLNFRGSVLTQAKLAFLAQANIPANDIFSLLW